jgi:intracellular sulfur oxidation DsrE/DsrF family protein
VVLELEILRGEVTRIADISAGKSFSVQAQAAKQARTTVELQYAIAGLAEIQYSIEEIMSGTILNGNSAGLQVEVLRAEIGSLRLAATEMRADALLGRDLAAGLVEAAEDAHGECAEILHNVTTLTRDMDKLRTDALASASAVHSLARAVEKKEDAVSELRMMLECTELELRACGRAMSDLHRDAVEKELLQERTKVELVRALY